VAESFVRIAILWGSAAVRKVAGCLTAYARVRKTVKGPSSVNSFLISRSLATLAKGIFIQKKLFLLDWK